MKNIIISSFILLAAVSCEMRFDLDIPEEPSKLFAFCVPGAQDTTAILIDVARFAGDKNRYDISKTEIDFRINGERQEVRFNAKDTVRSLPTDCFYVTSEIHPHDEISMTASLEGLGTVSAQTQVPSAPENMEFSIGEPDEYRKSRVSIRYTDDSEDTYYAVRIREKETTTSRMVYDGIEEVHEYVYWTDILLGYEFDPFQMYPEFNIRAFNNNMGICFWKNADMHTVAGSKEIAFDIYIKKDIENQSWMQTIDYAYEASLFRITKDLYDYYLSAHLNSENYLSYFGMADSGPENNTITGGFGILAGMGRQTILFDTQYTHKENYLPEV